VTAENGADPGPGSGPSAPTPAFFGAEPRVRREAAGLSRSEPVRRVRCAPSPVDKAEAAKRVPPREPAAFCDRELCAAGFLTRLWPVMIRNAYPAWFRPFADPGQRAGPVRPSETRLVPGLSQTVDRRGLPPRMA
jgi:hypothetical protein